MNRGVGVFWDWNGTLVNDAFVFVDIMNFFLKTREIETIDVKKYRDCFEFPIENYYKKLGFNLKKENFKEIGNDFIKKYKEMRFQASFFPNIKNLLILLKKEGFYNFAVSAQEHSLLSSAIDYYDVGDLFYDFVGVDNINAQGKTKVAKELLLKHRSILDKVFVVGDTPYDMEVAKAVDGDGILVSFGHYSKKRLLGTGFPLVDSVEELKKRIFQNVN